MIIKFGPAGLGPVKDAISTLEMYKSAGLKACEIAFTYGVYIKREEDMKKIKAAAEENEIALSIHAPYWINLNSKEKIKIEQSKMRILRCCEVGHKLGATRVVFHCGYYAGIDKEITYQNMKKGIIDIQNEIKKKGWKVKLCPETMGKINVFGSIEEIARLVDETDCGFCIDFAHILARDKKIDFGLINKKFGKHKKWHCHFSGIEYGEKGEKRHLHTERKDWKNLLENLPKDKEIVIINESPDCVEDSVEGLNISRKS